LYSTFIDGDYIENPDLEEEKAVNYEVGLRQSLGDYVTLQSNLFYSEIEDLITDGTIEVGGNLYDQKQNIGKAVYKGFEVFLNGFFMDINEFTLSYTYLDAENKSDDRTSDHIEAVPEHRLFMNHLVTLKEKFYVSSNLTLQTDQYEDNRGDWSSMGGMYLVDTKIGYKPSDRITLEAGVKNLFDRNYSYSDGYPMEGRYWFSKISLRI
jgi:iron complex outermembrane receptor protein